VAFGVQGLVRGARFSAHLDEAYLVLRCRKACVVHTRLRRAGFGGGGGGGRGLGGWVRGSGSGVREKGRGVRV
jgi:hypothetical protein